MQFLENGYLPKNKKTDRQRPWQSELLLIHANNKEVTFQVLKTSSWWDIHSKVQWGNIVNGRSIHLF